MGTEFTPTSGQSQLDNFTSEIFAKKIRRQGQRESSISTRAANLYQHG
jgi:hypothetical protein